jgi:hypothetical protein
MSHAVPRQDSSPESFARLLNRLTRAPAAHPHGMDASALNDSGGEISGLEAAGFDDEGQNSPLHDASLLDPLPAEQSVRVSLSDEAIALSAGRKRTLTPVRVLGQRTDRGRVEAGELSYERALRLHGRKHAAELPDLPPNPEEGKEASPAAPRLTRAQAEAKAMAALRRANERLSTADDAARPLQERTVKAKTRDAARPDVARPDAARSGPAVPKPHPAAPALAQRRHGSARQHAMPASAAPEPQAFSPAASRNGKPAERRTPRRLAEIAAGQRPNPPDAMAQTSPTLESSRRKHADRDRANQDGVNRDGANRDGANRDEANREVSHQTASGQARSGRATSRRATPATVTPASGSFELELTPTITALAQRQSIVSIRLNAVESQQLRQRAAESGISVSAYMRSCVLEAEHLRAQVKQALAELRASHPLATASAPRLASSQPEFLTATRNPATMMRTGFFGFLSSVAAVVLGRFHR